MRHPVINRRTILKYTAASALAATIKHSHANESSDCFPSQSSSRAHQADTGKIHPSQFKLIPSTNEQISSIGMGTWITFDVADNESVRQQRSQVLQAFFDNGGQMVDSSPMYGNAEAVLGYCLRQTTRDCALFSASKIWTPITFDGISQMKNSELLWGVQPMDLMYVHNLVNWENHLSQLKEWQQAGRIRYLGVSTSHGRRHDELEKILKTQKLDFVQLSYNYDKRTAQERLIPLAKDYGVAVVVNRPFERGHLVDKYKGSALPGIAVELGCQSWAQFLLLFIVSHPDITVAIPATSRVDHMKENMAVLQIEMPDEHARKQM